jgi:hypothetical protein
MPFEPSSELENGSLVVKAVEFSHLKIGKRKRMDSDSDSDVA